MITALYIHIPFCIKKCMYCDFLSVPFDEGVAAHYIKALQQEFNIRKDVAGELKTLYLGGGTPTSLSPELLRMLFTGIGKAFAISADAEITIEANPGTIDKDKIMTLKDCGVNRFSLGVQSFNDRELSLLDRIHSASEAIKAFAVLRDCGVKNISVDLIYGIPGQTVQDWRDNLATALELEPEHLSAYELTPEKGTPLYSAIMENKLGKPEEDVILEMYYYTLDALKTAGYSHYEISNFAREGLECRHNMNYWNRGGYIGLGAGAHSFIGDRRTSNTCDIKKYIDTLEAGSLAIEEDMAVTCEDAIKETIFLGLRKTEGLNTERFKEDFGVDISGAATESIKNGLLVSDREMLRLTTKGILVSNAVIVRLFEESGLD